MPLQSHLSLLLTYLFTTPSAADPTPPSNAAVGVTIGGHLEGALICQGAPQTILNHTVSEGAIGGVLNYFWTTQAFRQKEVRPPACPLLPGPPAAAATAAAVAARARPAAVAWPAAACLFSTIPRVLQVNTSQGLLRLPHEPPLLPLWVRWPFLPPSEPLALTPTGADRWAVIPQVDYFVDGEPNASVSLQPAMAAAQGFPDLMQRQNMRWDAVIRTAIAGDLPGLHSS